MATCCSVCYITTHQHVIHPQHTAPKTMSITQHLCPSSNCMRMESLTLRASKSSKASTSIACVSEADGGEDPVHAVMLSTASCSSRLAAESDCGERLADPAVAVWIAGFSGVNSSPAQLRFIIHYCACHEFFSDSACPMHMKHFFST